MDLNAPSLAPRFSKSIIEIGEGVLTFLRVRYNNQEHKPVIDAVLVVDVEQLVFDPGNLFGGLPPALSLQRVLLVDGCQAHHGLLTYTPLMEHRKRKKIDISNYGCMRI